MKEVSKWFKKCMREKMKRQQDIQRIIEAFKGVKNIPGIKSAKKSVLITKKKDEKGDIVTSRKGIPNVVGEFYNKYTTTMSKTNLNKKSVKMKMKAALMCTAAKNVSEDENPRDHDRRVVNCDQQTQKRQTTRQQRNPSRRHQSMRR